MGANATYGGNLAWDRSLRAEQGGTFLFQTQYEQYDGDPLGDSSGLSAKYLVSSGMPMCIHLDQFYNFTAIEAYMKASNISDCVTPGQSPCLAGRAHMLDIWPDATGEFSQLRPFINPNWPSIIAPKVNGAGKGGLFKSVNNRAACLALDGIFVASLAIFVVTILLVFGKMWSSLAGAAAGGREIRALEAAGQPTPAVPTAEEEEFLSVEALLAVPQVRTPHL